MSTRLIQVVAFVNVAPAATVALPHQININGIAKRPDYVAADTAGFTIVVTATQVSVTNTNAVPTTVGIWLELKHSIPRELGGLPNLTPQPFVAAAGASGGSPTIIVEDEGVAIPGNPFTVINFTGAGVTAADGGGGTADIAIPGGGGGAQAVVFDDAVPADQVNIRSNRALNQSPIDNTKVGITNLGSATGASPSTGATGVYATIGGGDDNSANGDYSTIAGGRHNSDGSVDPGYGFNAIGGGVDNAVGNPGYANAIVGGDANTNNADYASTIAGGASNVIDPDGIEAFIGGGDGNYVNNYGAAVGGGDNNRVEGELAVIAGGSDNTVNGDFSAILGGGSNNINSSFSTIAGGDSHWIGFSDPNQADNFIGAGRANSIDGEHSGIVAGQNNLINDDLLGVDECFIGAGAGNQIEEANRSAIVAGFDNLLHGGSDNSIIGGGRQNDLNGHYSVIGGGDGNDLVADWACIPGGRENVVNELGGFAIGDRNTVPVGGFNAQALGKYSSAYLEASLAFASGGEIGGTYQVNWLVGRGIGVGGGGVAALAFGETYNSITLRDNKAYAVRVRAIASGGTGVQVVEIIQEIVVTNIAGVATIAEQVQTLIRGTALAKANWTVTGSVAANQLSINFSTNADAATLNVFVTAHCEFVETRI